MPLRSPGRGSIDVPPLTYDSATSQYGRIVMASDARPRRKVMWALFALVLTLGSISDAGADPGGFVSDDFSSPVLNTARWTTVDPRGDTVFTASGTNLLISVAGGISHRLTVGDRTAPRILQSAPNANVEVEAKFESQPTAAVQTQGIVFQQDDLNLIWFGVERDGAGLFLQATALTGNKAKSLLRVASAPSPVVYLRVARAGNAWTIRSSPDGATWTTVGTVTAALTVTSAGPFAGNHATSGSPPAFTASVDYVFNTASPIVPEDGGGGGDTTPPVISGVTITPGPTSVHVGWTTDEPADTRVEVGTTTAYELGAVSDPSPVTSHASTFTGLTCETSYHMRVSSTDPSGNVRTAPDEVFQTSACGPPPTELVSDDLSGPELDPSRWSVIDPNGDAAVAMTGSGASVSLPAGTPHGFTGGVNRTVRLVQPVANEDLEVDVRFEPLVASGNTAFEGILVEQDAGNYLRFELSTVACQYRLQAFSQSGATLTSRLNRTIPTPPSHLRVRRTGNTWFFSVSFDGLAWKQMVSFSHVLAPTAVGPYVGSEGGPSPAVTGTVDYLVDRTHPFATEDGVPFEAVPQDPVIDVWYGSDQTFGGVGRPQAWVNVLGTVSDPDEVASLRYSLNGGPSTAFPLGMDFARLQRPGDFNIELAWAALQTGDNTITLTAQDRSGNQSQRTVTVRVVSGTTLPQSYSVDWSSAGSIGEVAQVVDGQWRIEGDGVRTVVPGYDRLITLGDPAWASYQVSTPVTIHGFSAGGCAGAAVGLIVGWTGHTDPGQPRRGHPYGGLGWYRGALEILRNGDAVIARDRSGLTLSPGVQYIFKMQMERTSVSPPQYTYRLKVWRASDPEPGAWTLTAAYDFGGGSVVLLAHHVDASFGDVTITPIGPGG
jgi:large repetitive protein